MSRPQPRRRSRQHAALTNAEAREAWAARKFFKRVADEIKDKVKRERETPLEEIIEQALVKLDGIPVCRRVAERTVFVPLDGLEELESLLTSRSPLAPTSGSA